MQAFTQKQLNECMKLVASQYDVTLSWVRRHLGSYCEDMLARQGQLELPDVPQPEGRGLEEPTK